MLCPTSVNNVLVLFLCFSMYRKINTIDFDAEMWRRNYKSVFKQNKHIVICDVWCVYGRIAHICKSIGYGKWSTQKHKTKGKLIGPHGPPISSPQIESPNDKWIYGYWPSLNPYIFAHNHFEVFICTNKMSQSTSNYGNRHTKTCSQEYMKPKLNVTNRINSTKKKNFHYFMLSEIKFSAFRSGFCYRKSF